jgi:hypothetical protein
MYEEDISESLVHVLSYALFGGGSRISQITCQESPPIVFLFLHVVVKSDILHFGLLILQVSSYNGGETEGNKKERKKERKRNKVLV